MTSSTRIKNRTSPNILRAIEALEKLNPVRADDYKGWIDAGMILHSVDQSEEMLGRWIEWSNQSNKHRGPDECAAKWTTFNPDGGLGLGTLILCAEEDVANNGQLSHRKKVERKVRPAPEKENVIDWRKRNSSYVNDLKRNRAGAWAKRLGIEPVILQNYRCGFGSLESSLTCAERDPSGKITAIVHRHQDGRKIPEKGGTRGLIFRRGKIPADIATAICCEGLTSTLAVASLLMDRDIVVFGRPSISAKKELVVEYANRLSPKLFVIVADRGDDKSCKTLADMLIDAGHQVKIIWPPKPHDDVRSWINNNGTRVEFQRMIDEAPVESIDKTAETAEAAERFRLTDLGNGERLVHRHGRNFRYCYPWKRFLVWDGKRWVIDDQGLVNKLATETARSIYNEAAEEEDEVRRQLIAKWAASSEQERKLRAMIELAKFQSDIPVLPSQLNKDVWKFNCKNGTIDLRTGKLHEHRREDLITKIAPIKYDPDAKSPRWRKFLKRIFDDNDNLIDYVCRVLGMSLTGDVREQHLYVAYGSGANGKSVLFDTVIGIMGEYAGSTAPYLMVMRQHDEHPVEIADLFGKRLMVASETERGSQLRIQLIKKLTGDQTIKARRLYENYFEFKATHKLFLVTNNKPKITEDSEAVWRRIRLIPFTVTIPKDERDPKLLRKLRKEKAGIFAALVRACLEWKHGGLQDSKEVEKATESYRTESDSFKSFISEKCKLGSKVKKSRTGVLRSRYISFCSDRGREPLTLHEWYGRLLDVGCVNTKHRGYRVWKGIESV